MGRTNLVWFQAGEEIYLFQNADRSWLVTNLIFFPGIFPKIIRKAVKIHSQYSLVYSRHLNVVLQNRKTQSQSDFE
jgi:hypothetical protein